MLKIVKVTISGVRAYVQELIDFNCELRCDVDFTNIANLDESLTGHVLRGTNIIWVAIVSKRRAM